MHHKPFASRKIDFRFRLLAALILAALLALPIPPAGASGDGEAPPPLPWRTEAEVLVILAHPDDEGVVAPLLARLALEEKKAVVNVYVTDGRNGSDRSRGLKGKALGLARMTELHWALDHLGVAMFHTLGRADAVAAGGDPRAVLEAWGRQETVGELARFIRLLRPRLLVTWVPGPPSGHAEHAAAGAAALEACRAAALPGSFPDQIGREGLEAWEVPEVRVVAQPEKLGYARAPAPRDDEAAAARIRTEIVDAVSPTLGLRYSDIAREAMKEHRSVAMVNNQSRLGPFDDPLRLVRVFGGPLEPVIDDPRVSVATLGSQRFFERVSEAIGDPGLARLFPAELVLPAEEPASLTIVVESRHALDGTLALDLPEGWTARPRSRELHLEAAGSRSLGFVVTPPSGGAGGYAAATVSLDSGEGPRPALHLALRRSDTPRS